MKKIKNKIDYFIDRLNFKIKYLIANTIMKKKVDSGNNYFKIMSDNELVDKIVNEKKSYTRFGDGELSLILQDKFQLGFQKNNKSLKEKLKVVLNSNLDNLIIGINYSFNDPSIYNKKVQKYCRAFNYIYREKYKTIIPNDKVFGNSSITRFYIDYDNSDINGAIARLNNLKRIWNHKKILIVEGNQTKLGVGNDLFDNTISIRRILVPSTNAYDKLDEIIDIVKKYKKEDELILLAVGPTATILAYEFSLLNMHAVDVGHIDIEYEWMKLRVKKRVPIKGKYVNEIRGNKYQEDNSLNESYLNSIVYEVK